MYPTNHYMDPYSSYYRHHAPYPYYPPPGWEAGHKQMPEADSSCRPPYGPWPYSGSMNNSGLPESHSHSCCSHTYPPGYYSFRPPFPQELPPPPPALYYHGPFPPHHHPNPYSSSPYFGPLPPYPADQTPYNGYYDKFPKSHCCGCPNHACHGDGGQRSSVKIEEHNMPAEVKDDSRQKVADNNSSIIRNPNYQYPVMWLPSGDMKDNKGTGRSFEFPPHLFSKWFPQSGERAEDAKPADDSQKAKQHQWPMVWLPPGYGETKPEAKKELKAIEQSPKNTQEDPPSPKIKIIPLSWFGNDHHDQKPAARDGSGEQNGRSSVANPAAGTEHQHDTTGDGNCKTIPVVPEKPNSGKEPATSAVPQKANSGNKPAISVVPEKQDVEKKVRTCRTIPVMPQKVSDEKKSYMDESKEEKKVIEVRKEGENKKTGNVESSKAKPSKLPPVCLRVDPLPKKKSGNTSSRSSNQATKKVCEKVKDVKVAQAKNQEPKISDHKKEGNVPVKEKSSEEIAKNTGPRNVTVLDASVKHAQEEQVSTSITDQKVQPTVSAEAQENGTARNLQECDKNIKEDQLKIQGEASDLAREISLSEPDAAVRIQSAYRGYHVRRWQPLEKLRKIKNVHMQMQEVEKQLQALEASSKQPTEKEHIAMNETIMNLLLNLDTIQNLHPVVREARKSVARQLVCLQEKLDSLCKKLPAEPSHPKSEEASLTGVDEGQLPSSVNSKSEEASLTGVDEEQLPMHDEVSSEVSLKLSQDGACTEPNHPKSEEASLTGVDEGQLASLVNSNEPMHDEVSSEVSLKLSQDGACCTEQTHQMEESSTANEEAQDEGKAAAAGECQDLMPDADLSGLITEKKHQMQEPDILGEESVEEEKAAVAKSEEGLSTHCLDGSVSKQCSEGSAERNWNTQESNQRVSPTTTEDDTTAVAAASTDSEMAADNDGSAEGGQVQESASIGISCLKHDDAPAEDQCKEASAPFHHLEDSSVTSQFADAHVITNPGDQQEESVVDDMQKEVADAMLDSGKEPNGTPTPRTIGDAGNMDDVTGANSDNTEQEKIVLVGSETAKQCEVSGKVDSTLVDQQNELAVEDPAGGSAIAKETEAVPSDVEGKPMENSPNDALGEVPEAVPVESEDKTMEHSLNDAIGQEPEAIAALESRADAIVEESEAVALEIDGKSTENTLDDVIGEEPEAAPLENMENTLNVAIGEEPEAVPLESRDETIEKTLKDAPGEEPEAAVPVETEGNTMENTLNDAIEEEPEAAPLENRGNTVEDSLNDSGSVSNTSPEPALPGGTGDGLPGEHDGGRALYGDNPDSKLPWKSQGNLLQTEEHDDGGKLGASEAAEVNATMPEETVSCATGANSAAPVLEAGKPEEGAEGAPPEAEEAAAATHDNNGPKKGDDNVDKNKGLTDENERLKEMLQKLVASGNEQMGVIAELSDKVKSLERKLAVHKRRKPKVRVQHRPARNATSTEVSGCL